MTLKDEFEACDLSKQQQSQFLQRPRSHATMETACMRWRFSTGQSTVAQKWHRSSATQTTCLPCLSSLLPGLGPGLIRKTWVLFLTAEGKIGKTHSHVSQTATPGQPHTNLRYRASQQLLIAAFSRSQNGKKKCRCCPRNTRTRRSSRDSGVSSGASVKLVVEQIRTRTLKSGSVFRTARSATKS